ncbi:ADP-ribose 1''-phosphate phosphatase [Lobaria immixta]|nr:ADP-ribose 1''-phosphate phosphatase [Lobaria immixta]
MANITEQTGDIFSAPANTVLIHACNAKGVWGSGVALAFKKKFPKAFQAYAAHCKPPSSNPANLADHQRALAGTAFLLPPSPPQENHWIACLFTSVGYGRSVDSPEQIMANTERAVADLARQIGEFRSRDQDGTEAMGSPAIPPENSQVEKAMPILGSCWSVRLNSGKFGVEWSRTKTVLEHGTLDIHVVRPQSEDHGEPSGKNQEGGG